MSFKLTPFLRQTQDQVENFYINYTAGITSGLNAGYPDVVGFRVAVRQGRFQPQRLRRPALLCVHLRDRALQRRCPTAATSSRRSTRASRSTTPTRKPARRAAAPTVRNSSVKRSAVTRPAVRTPRPATRPAARRIRPAAAKTRSRTRTGSLRRTRCCDPRAAYLPYSIFPGPIGSGVNAYNYPYVATLLLNYKHDKFTITPSFQFVAGNRYGAPLTTPGIDPASGCGKPLSAGIAGDPRYPYGAAGGHPYNADQGGCAATLSIPDPYTGQFDGIGAFREPAQLLGHLQIAYDVSPRVNLIAHARELAADLLRRSAHGLHVPLEQSGLFVHESRRRS